MLVLEPYGVYIGHFDPFPYTCSWFFTFYVFVLLLVDSYIHPTFYRCSSSVCRCAVGNVYRTFWLTHSLALFSSKPCLLAVHSPPDLCISGADCLNIGSLARTIWKTRYPSHSVFRAVSYRCSCLWKLVCKGRERRAPTALVSTQLDKQALNGYVWAQRSPACAQPCRKINTHRQVCLMCYDATAYSDRMCSGVYKVYDADVYSGKG